MNSYYPIDKWYKKDKNNISAGYNVFFGDLLKNKIEWLNTERDNSLNIGSIKLASNINLSLTKESIILLNKKVKIKNLIQKKCNISILKSNLQKSIRRCYVENAVNTAIQIIISNKNGLSVLLRRLSIIVLEDSILTYDYIKLIFLMCLTTKFNLVNFEKDIFISEYVYKFCIQFIKYITAIKIYDPSYKITKIKEKITLNKILNSTLSNKNKNLLLCIFTRTFYGGMVCDIDMLKKIINIWYLRLLSKNILWENILTLKPNYNIQYIDTVNRFTKNSIVIQAIDFHCSNIVDKIKNKYPFILEEEIKYAIWYYSSSITYKAPIIPYFRENKNIYKKTWKKIFITYNKLSKKIIDKNY